ncbi:MAG TPA: hypothetical protein PLX06_05350 [Fimbriimonadaceae bacterium]|nr:hypothetical protein [Fimbriimonadaceae bacterium]
MKQFSRYLTFILALVLAVGALAQSEPKQPSPPQDPPVAKEADVASIDAIVAALYDVISGPAGQKRDWDRMRSLFTTDAKMGAVVKRANGTLARVAFSVEEYITRNQKALEEGGFFEKEMVKHVDRYGNIAQVFTSYEARRAAADEKPFMRGINSLTLWNDGKRWYIQNILWQAEGPENPVPAEFVKGG